MGPATPPAAGPGPQPGPRSVFTKGLADSRGALALVTVFLVAFVFVGSIAVREAFGTAETRRQMADLARLLPSVFQSMLGRPVGLETLGGIIEWRYYAVLFLLLPIWPIVALSGTLAGEAGRGSLDLLVAAGVSRRRIATQKLAAHLAGVAITMVVLAAILWLAGLAYATLPGDEIGVGAALGYAVLTAVMMLIPGSIAWAAAPIVGRTPAAGLAVLAMLTAYLANAFRDTFPAFDAIAPVSWFAWTADHLPLAGHDDWPSLALPALVIVALLIVGLLAFERSDIGATIRLPSPHLPGALLGLHGPLGRGLSARVGIASVWGVGVGVYVMLVVGTASDLVRLIQAAPMLDQMMRLVYPDIDYASAGGLLQLIFIEFGLIVFGFAAATIVSGWASDEASGRLEELLATPISRIWWFVRSGLGTYLAIVLAAAIVAVGVGLAAQGGGGDVLAPVAGAFVLALYGCALAGVGFAVAGLFRSSLAAPVVAGLTIATFLDTLFARPLRLPDWVTGLALSTHYGQPMVGQWDPVGVAVSAILATGGLIAGAWGFSGRDVRT
ncbi:MAG TPA: hypothetical protein VF494_04005 [Candidatus Limnocylindrales bacterium]